MEHMLTEYVHAIKFWIAFNARISFSYIKPQVIHMQSAVYANQGYIRWWGSFWDWLMHVEC